MTGLTTNPVTDKTKREDKAGFKSQMKVIESEQQLNSIGINKFMLARDK